MCEYGYIDCQNENKKCHLCIDGIKYIPPKQKKQTIKYAKENGRKGSRFEAVNHNSNAELLSGASTRLTPNSGAGYVKGDEEIRGIINIMEELKEYETYNARGEQTFSIDKAWLDKLDREGTEARKEFWYLKFRYKGDKHWYIAVKDDVIMGMVYTLQEDRVTKLKAENAVQVANKRAELIDKENTALKAKIAELETKIELMELEKNGTNISL